MKHPIPVENLLAYWLGETEGDEVEEHLFACAECSARLEEIAALGAGIRAVVREGRVSAVISGPFLEALRRQGMRIREYRVPAGGSVDCTLLADEHAVASTIEAPLASVTRLDALMRVEAGGKVTEARVEDVPFDAAAGEVVLLQSSEALRRLPAHVHRLRLVAVEGKAERVVGEYTFVHTPG